MVVVAQLLLMCDHSHAFQRDNIKKRCSHKATVSDQQRLPSVLITMVRKDIRSS